MTKKDGNARGQQPARNAADAARHRAPRARADWEPSRPQTIACEADGEADLPAFQHREGTLAELVARATGMPAGVVDLGGRGGPVVYADDSVAERICKVWRAPARAGVIPLMDSSGATRRSVGIAVAAPLRLGGRRGWIAAVDMGLRVAEARHQAMAELFQQLADDADTHGAAHGLWVDRLRAENAHLHRINRLAGIGTLRARHASGEITACARARDILKIRAPGSLADILAPFGAHDRASLREALCGEATEPFTLDLQTDDRAGSGTPVRLRIEFDVAANGLVSGWVATVEDLSDHQRQIDDLRILAERDPLTGVFSQNCLSGAIAEAIAEANRTRELVGFLLVSLDCYRETTQLFGHRAGDALVRFVARALSNFVRASDKVVRAGPTEFAVILTRANEEDGLLRRAETILAALDAQVSVGDDKILTSSSIGLAIYPQDTAEGVELYAAADYALNEARAQDKRRFLLRYDHEISRRCEMERRFNENVLRGLANAEFVPYFQPQIDLESGKIVGFEALCRWNHPERGVLTPGAFHKALETPVIGAELSDVTLHGAFEATAELRERGLAFGHIAINLSAYQLARPSLIETVDELAERCGTSPAEIVFEVLENVLIRNNKVVNANLRALGERGYVLALDDFGTGHASLTHIREPFIGQLKIDRSFVSNSSTDKQDQQIVTGIVQMGRRLNLSMVAEGIEDEQTLRKLRSIGCPTGQGFVFSPALPLSEAVAFLERQNRIFSLLNDVSN